MFAVYSMKIVKSLDSVVVNVPGQFGVDLCMGLVSGIVTHKV